MQTAEPKIMFMCIYILLGKYEVFLRFFPYLWIADRIADRIALRVDRIADRIGS